MVHERGSSEDRPPGRAGPRSLLLTLLILLHKGKGGGLSDMFGGGMSSTLGGSSVAERNLDRFTVAVGLVWVAAIVGLGLIERFSELTTCRGAERPCRPPAPDLTKEYTVASGNAIRGSRVGAGPDGRGRARRRRRPRSSSPTGAPTATRPGPASPRRPAPASPRPGTARAAGFPAGQDQENPPAAAAGRAVQDAPGLREGAAQRRRRRGDPRRGAADAARPRADPLSSG